MSSLNEKEFHQNVMSAMECWMEAISKVQARRKEEITNATNRHRSGAPRNHDERGMLYNREHYISYPILLTEYSYIFLFGCFRCDCSRSSYCWAFFRMSQGTYCSLVCSSSFVEGRLYPTWRHVKESWDSCSRERSTERASTAAGCPSHGYQQTSTCKSISACWR